MDKRTRQDSFDKEYTDSLNKLYRENSGLTGFKWFLDTAHRWAYRPVEHDVVILGAAVPEELVIASGAEPHWFIGGSLGSTEWSDELVPRDTDPVSRSILGYINRPGIDCSDAMFIIPLTNDSMRKIAYILKSEGRKIFTVDIPPDRSDKHAVKKYAKQMEQMCAAISAHTGSAVTRRSAAAAMKLVSGARAALCRFLEVSRGRTDIITDSARAFVQNSYYMTASAGEWTHRLEELSNEVEYYALRTKNKERRRPGVMLAGSPVLFPNYKIPFLIRDAGLAVYDTADYITLRSMVIYNSEMLHGSRSRLIESIASQWCRYDASSSYVKNDVMYEYISYIIQRGNTEGVVFHVLKGQIEYDFELERIEAMLSERGIPVFRLETDYQYQDVEQLRIRMEAFSEMLVQNRIRKVKRAS